MEDLAAGGLDALQEGDSLLGRERRALVPSLPRGWARRAPEVAGVVGLEPRGLDVVTCPVPKSAMSNRLIGRADLFDGWGPSGGAARDRGPAMVSPGSSYGRRLERYSRGCRSSAAPCPPRRGHCTGGNWAVTRGRWWNELVALSR